MLSLIVFLPLVAAIVVASLRAEHAKRAGWIAFVAAFQTFVLSLTLIQSFGGGSPFFLEENFSWLPSLGVRYHLGADEMSFLMVALTGLLTAIAAAASIASIEKDQRFFFSLLLLLQCGVNGTFLSLDLVLFYIFWELMLIPLYFMIGMFGSKNRRAATVKFFLFTFAGSVFMLIALLYVAAKAGTSDFSAILAKLNAETLVFTAREAFWLFLGFFVAFAIKVPLFPLHTWLPDAHTEAPTAGSVMLAGVLLKTGVYGMIRFCIPLFFPWMSPGDQGLVEATVLILSAVAIVWGALAAIAQTDMKRLVAYSSVSHMGFIMLGLFSLNEVAINGAILQMVNHGISTSGLFLCVGMLYERRHTREMSEFGGLASNLKIYAALTMVMVLSSVGLPMLNGFVGEFWILAGAFQRSQLLATVGATGVILGAVYLLTMYQKVFYGPLDATKNGHLADLGDREIYILAPLVVLAVWIGVYSTPFTEMLRGASRATANAALVAKPSAIRAIERQRTAMAPPAGGSSALAALPAASQAEEVALAVDGEARLPLASTGDVSARG